MLVCVHVSTVTCIIIMWFVLPDASYNELPRIFNHNCSTAQKYIFSIDSE